jgi:hypothetical protein
MKSPARLTQAGFLTGIVLLPGVANAQGTVVDYDRAMTLRDTYQGLALNVPEQARWIEGTNRFWYRRSVKGGNDFVLVNADTQTKGAPFDHVKLAAAISSATGGKYTAVTLPFSIFTYVDRDRAIEFALSTDGPAGRGTAAGPASRRCGAVRSTPIPAGRPQPQGEVAEADAVAAGWPDRFGRLSTSTAPSRKSRPTRSSRRSSTTTTSRFASRASAR